MTDYEYEKLLKDYGLDGLPENPEVRALLVQNKILHEYLNYETNYLLEISETLQKELHEMNNRLFFTDEKFYDRITEIKDVLMDISDRI